VLILLSIFLILALLMLYLTFRNKFKSATIELGTDELSINQFLVSSMYEKKATFVTEYDDIDFERIGEQPIVLQYNNKQETVNLIIQDTTPPIVQFKNLTEYTDYQIDPNDFVESKEDYSEMIVETNDVIDTSKYGEHIIHVTVKDKYNNETSQDCILTICWLKKEYTLELGTKLTKEDLVVNIEKDASKVPQEELDKINNSDIGTYEIVCNYEEVEYKCTVTVQDTTPPNLVLKNVSVYDDETVSGKEAFIASCSDASGSYETKLKTNINNSKIGTQTITIEAVDKYGNSIEKSCTYTRRYDTDGPVFSGLTEITSAKNAKIDYYKGVSCVDKKDGKCEFTVDTSGVNTSAAGTYYVTYTGADTKGNKTTSKRKVILTHDASDVSALVREIASQCGNTVQEIHDFVQKKIVYAETYGGSDPVWYGFTQWRGNCWVHAMCYQALLRAKGYTTQLIWVTNKTHYWNLIYTNGKWWHSDSTPDRNHRRLPVLATDSQRYNLLSGRNWDRSAWPSC